MQDRTWITYAKLAGLVSLLAACNNTPAPQTGGISTGPQVQLQVDRDGEGGSTTFEVVKSTDTKVTAPQPIFNVKASVSEGQISSLTLQVDGTEYDVQSNKPFTFPTPLSAGNHSVKVVAKDSKGLEKTFTTNIKVDATAPSLAVTLPAGTVSGDVVIPFQSQDNESGVLGAVLIVDKKTVAISNNASGSFVLSTSSLSDGEHEVAVVTFNNVGMSNSRVGTIVVQNSNTSAPTVKVLFNGKEIPANLKAITTTKPQFTVEATSGTVNGGDVGYSSITYTVTRLSDGSVVETKTLNDPQNTNTFVLENTLGSGDYRLTVKVTNKAKLTATSIRDFTVDATAPVVNVVSPAATAVVKEQIQFRIQASDPESKITKIEISEGSEVRAIKTYDTPTAPDADVYLPIDTTKISDGEHTFEVRVTNGVGMTTLRTVTVKISNTPEKQTPIVNIINKEQLTNGTKSGIIVVRAQIESQAGVKRAELLVNGSPTGEVITTANGEFQLDTTLLPNGKVPIQVKAISTENVQGLSEEVLIDIKNLLAPTFSITAPGDGETLSNRLSVGVSVSKQVTNFDFLCLDGALNPQANPDCPAIAVTVYEPGGKVETEVTIPYNKLVNNADGVYYTTPIDWSKFPNDKYTLTARSRVKLTNPADPTEVQVRTLSNSQQNNVLFQSDQPPAGNIVMPVGLQGGGLPIVNRATGVMLQATDDSDLRRVEVRLINEKRNVNALLLNLPLDQDATIKKFNYLMPVLELDGSENVPDSDPANPEETSYILRMIVEDDGNHSNSQELRVMVLRDQDQIMANNNVEVTPFANRLTEVVRRSQPRLGQTDLESATWAMCENGLAVNPATRSDVEPPATSNCLPIALLNQSRVMVVTTLNGEVVETDSYASHKAGQPLPSIRVFFSEQGSYNVYYLVEDLVTGITYQYKGTPVAVRIVTE